MLEEGDRTEGSSWREALLQVILGELVEDTVDGKQLYIWISKKEHSRGAQLAQSEDRVTLDLGEGSSNPTLGVEMT